jgi:sec-independent protein translocase protein TatA
MTYLSSVPVMIAMPGPLELLLILLIVLLVFGAARLPQIFKSMGSGIHEFKKGLKEGEKGQKKDDKESGHTHGDKCRH